jgi:predicted metal-dependent hydrolase
MLARVRIKIRKFMKHIKHKRLNTKYKANLLESNSSYTIAKGRKIHLCLREQDSSNKLVDENTLFFVALHELAHVMTISIGHTKEFWSNFRYLLRKAINLKYYKYRPYHIQAKKYCGTLITNTPYQLGGLQVSP